MLQIDLDMVLESTRNASGLLCIPSGPIRDAIEARGIHQMTIVEEFGSAGGNPVVRLVASRPALERYLREVYCEYLPEAERTMYLGMMKPYEPPRGGLR